MKEKFKCTKCRGKGRIWWQLNAICPGCGGEGWVYLSPETTEDLKKVNKTLDKLLKGKP